jgi:galactokinase
MAKSRSHATSERMSAASVHTLFREAYAARPDRIASAPARVNLIGEHTDYNGGEVLPIGIDRRTFVAVRTRADGGPSRAVSGDQRAMGTFDTTRPERSGEWWDYVAGVTRELTARGFEIPSLDIAVASDVPSGAGISSSAALAVATAMAIGDLLHLSLPPRMAAEVAWRAETLFVGVPCGIMDQFASALAEEHAALHLWCDTMRSELVPCREHVLVFDTGVSRVLRQSAFAQRRDECARALRELRRKDPGLKDLAHATLAGIDSSDMDQVLRDRATHVVRESARVRESVVALAAYGTIPGELLSASHQSLRDLYACSSPELDWFVEHALGLPGVRGARLTGAGWGGCAIATGAEDALSAIGESLVREYGRAFPHAARSWLVRPAAGARIEASA